MKNPGIDESESLTKQGGGEGRIYLFHDRFIIFAF